MRASLDLSTAPAPQSLTTEVCVIGAGVAGQTVARRLAAAGRSVVLAESGGRDFDGRTQDLARGTTVGHAYYPLDTARLRLYGGTTAIWGGRCASLDPIDFERRDWVSYSGWPISHATLEPYMDEAFAAFGVPRPRAHADIGAEAPGFDPQKIDSPLWAFDEQAERFTNPADLGSDRITLVLNANLTGLITGGNEALQYARFQSLTGQQLEVRAHLYVLATGGIEAPRLLLAASDRAGGLGNSRDLVGRFFMEHPHARGGQVIPMDHSAQALARILELAPRAIRSQGIRFSPAFRLAEEAQRQLGLLNSVFSLSVRRHPGQAQDLGARLIGGVKHQMPAKKLLRRLYHFGKTIRGRSVERRSLNRQVDRLLRQREVYGLYAVIRAEQAPNPQSRVRLGTGCDALGMPRAVLDWQLSQIDKDTVSGLMQVFGAELTRLGLGRVEPAAWLRDPGELWQIDPLISSHPIGGYHHIGTTRMGSSPAAGVVDADCRVFDCPNLYIAGSSVFPTAGWANPTAPIMGLAMRLGDHLHQQL